MLATVGKIDLPAVHFLQPVQQHRPVFFSKNRRPHLDHVGRRHRQEVPVVRRMVQLAQREPVRDDRFAVGLGVPDDVRRVEQLLVPQAAQRALGLVRAQHALAKGALMEPGPRYFHHAIEQFGPERCMFESNFPVDKCAVTYAVLWNAYKKMAARYSAAEQDSMFRATATKFYGIG